MSTSYILISNSVVQCFSDGSVLLDKIIQITLDHGCKARSVNVDPEYGLIGKYLGKFSADATVHAVTDAGSFKLVLEETCHRVRTYLKSISVIVKRKKVSEPSCDNERDKFQSG